ncbi:MAG: helix-turn-helix transcriptional regulator [Candidatus Poribacteria bacterium]|nr:helix-turn-helix transcriptional regulator [Candidatus Poribacteria bacterium]
MVGERLRRFRLVPGMSLGNLEAAIDGLVSSQTLSKYERGKLQPTASEIKASSGILIIQRNPNVIPIVEG